MSDAKKFKPKVLDEKVLKQLKDFEFTLPKLVQSEEFHDLVKKVSLFEEKISVLSEQLHPLDVFLKKLEDRIDRQDKKVSRAQIDLSKLEEREAKRRSKIEDTVSKILSEVKSLGGDLSSQKEELFKHKEVSRKFVGKADFGTLYSKVTDLFNKMQEQKNEIEKFADDKVSIQNQLKDRAYDIQVILSTLEEHWTKMDGLYKDLQSQVDREREVIPKMQKSIDFLVENVPKEIDTRIEAIEFPPSGLNEDKAKDFIDQKFVPISLESKNASLRSSNNEMKLNLLEKRLDHLSVTLKRFELEG